MDSLTEQQREQIKKMSDDRLRENLRKAGTPEVAIISLDRPSLLLQICLGRTRSQWT